METSSRQRAIWRSAELQMLGGIVVLVPLSVPFAVWNQGMPQVLSHPVLWLLLLIGGVALSEGLAVLRRGASWAPRWLLPLLITGTTLQNLLYVGVTGHGWVLGAAAVCYMRLPASMAALAALLAVLSSAAILLLGTQADLFEVVRALLWSLLIVGVLAIYFRATRRFSDELDRTTALLQNSMETMSQGISVMDPAGRVILYNQRLCDMLDLPDALLRQQPTLDEVVRHQQRQGHFGDNLELVQEDARAYVASHGLDPAQDPPARYLRQTRTGRTLEILTHAMPDGTVVRTYSDVTLHEQARRAAEQAAQAKSAFLSNMSHELRTPMSSVLGLVGLLKDTPLDTQQRDYVRKMEGAGRSLLALLNDILDFSKAEAGKMVLAPEPVRLDEFLHDLAALGSSLIGSRPLELRLDIDPQLPAGVHVDALRLRQVLVNLLGNAIKFTPAGSVTLQVRVQGADARQARLRWAVSDTGIGVAADQQQRIFESFTQADTSTSRRYGGTGLGLAISQRLLALMGSGLSLESTLGAGSRFWFDLTLPLAAAPPPTAQTPDVSAPTPGAPHVARLAGLRVLLAEDEPVNREVAYKLLLREGCGVHLAHNGQQAVDAVAADGAAFDCVLMDMQMPVLDGLGATRHIRAMLRESSLPIYAMTANVLDAERQACLQAGMNGHIAKPFDLERVVSVLRPHAPRAAARPAQANDQAR